MSSTATLLLALLIYLGAAAYAYRSAFFAWRDRHALGYTPPAPMRHTTYPIADRPFVRAAGIVLFVVVGGVMVLAGTALVLDSGNVSHGLPFSGQEFMQLMKDVVPGMISIVVGFLLLETTNRTLGGRGLRQG